MSEFVIFVESVTSAGWIFLCALSLLSLGFLLFDRQPQKQKRAGAVDEAQPRARRAA